MSIGLRIKDLRKGHGISQKKLAESIGVSAGNVGEWELGRSKPGADALISLSRYFNVSTDWLLTGMAADTQKLEQTSVGIDLSPDEIELIAKYRLLSDRHKGRIEGHIDALLGDTSAANQNTTSSYSKNGSGEEAAAKEGA